MQDLLDQSRRDHAKLCQEMDGKEAAWERVVSRKESYALQVQEKTQEIQRLERTLKESREEYQALHEQAGHLPSENLVLKATVESDRQRIQKLDGIVQQLQCQLKQMQIQQDEQTRDHTASVHQLRRALAERDELAATLEKECATLRSEHTHTVRAYEHEMGVLKQKHAETVKAISFPQQKQPPPQQLATPQIPTVDPLIIDQRRRLEDQLDIATRALQDERSHISAARVELAQLRDQLKQMHAASQTHETQYATLERDLASEIQAKRKCMDETNVALLKQAEAREQVEQLQLVKGKMERELAETHRMNARLEQDLHAARGELDQYRIAFAEMEAKYDQLLLVQSTTTSDGKQQNCSCCIQLKQELANQRERYRVLEGDPESRSQLLEALGTERDRVRALEKQLHRPYQQQNVPITPTSPAHNSGFLRDSEDDDDMYCEICEVYGHDVMGCTAFLNASTPAGPGVDNDEVDDDDDVAVQGNTGLSSLPVSV